MKIQSRLKGAAAPIALSIALMAQPAFAQDDTSGDETPVAADSASTDGNAIVVTGSRIRRDEFSTAEPLTVITSEEITQAGFNSATEALQSNQVTQGSSQINNYFAGYVTDGGTGANTLSLRGLGPSRTLVLLNGHRLAPAGTRGSVGSVDLNILPTAIIDRIEILKAGASSIYGSDAVAGVVNLVTDTKLEGVVIEGQVNAPELGAGSSYRLSGSFGYTGERFHILGSVEWYRRDNLPRYKADWTHCPIAGYLTGEGTEMGSGDYVDPNTGEPACNTLDNGGVTINTLGVPTRQAYARYSDTLGNYNRLIPDPSVVDGPTPGYRGVTYYTRDTFDPRQEEEPLVNPVETYTGFVQAGYDTGILGDAEFYVEMLGNQRKSSTVLYRQLSLDYAQGSPLLPLMFRNGAFLNPNEVSNGNLVAARAFIGFGNLSTSQEVDFAKVSGGLRGNFFMPGWRYDMYLSKAWSDGSYSTESFLTDRLARSLNVVDNGDGTFSCADLSDANCVAAPALSADVIGGILPQDWKDYIVDNVTGTTKYREFTASLNVDGPVFALPGGDAQLAVGLEYRDASIDDTPPQDSINSNLYNLSSATPTRGSDDVWEIYSEIYLPLLSDVPGAYRLNLNASGRYTEYNSYGGDWTYKIAGEWEPIRGVGFRASYGTSYRAPALFEQFLGGTSGFLSSSYDPCDEYGSQTNPAITANCASIGLAPDFQQNSGVAVITAGGASSGLSAETSTNFSAGVVLRPELGKLGDLSVALDYFDIQVNNGVARAGAANILTLCYAASDFDPNQGFCRLVHRDANNKLTVDNNYVNLSTDKVRGWEFNLRYANDIGPGRFTFNAAVTKYDEQSSRLFADDPLKDANGIIGAPEWTGSFDASYRVGIVTFRYGVDWVGGDHENTYNFIAFDSDTGMPNPDDVQFLKDNYYWEVDDYFLHDASVQVNFDRFQITAGVKNLFDTAPPRVSVPDYGGFSMAAGNAALYSGYNYTGRTWFVNTSVKF